MALMVPAKSPRMTALVYHADASACIKKALFDRAKSLWRHELDKVPAKIFLTHAQQTQS